jgi:hypothetical protein
MDFYGELFKRSLNTGKPADMTLAVAKAILSGAGLTRDAIHSKRKLHRMCGEFLDPL